MDWGPFDQVMQYMGGGDHQGGPSGDPGGRGSGIGRSFDSGVTEVTYGLEGVVVTFIWNPIDTLFWFGPGSPFGGLESSVFGGLVLNGYANNALPTLGGGRADSGSTGSAGAAGGNNLLAEFRKEYAKYNLTQTANFFEKAAWVPTAAVAAPVVGYFGLVGVNAYLVNPPFWTTVGWTAAAGIFGFEENPGMPPTNTAEWVGQGIDWAWQIMDHGR